MRTSITGVFGTLMLLIIVAAAQSLPYIPTTVLIPDNSAPNRDLAYIFRPRFSDAKHELLSLNISSNVSTSNLNLTLLSTSLPFQTSDSEAYVPAISSAGDVSVFTGSCLSSPELWRYEPDRRSANGNGTWKEKVISKGSLNALQGARFLSRSFTFSPYVKANATQTSIYAFGGMCPDEDSTVSSWQATAQYSNTMIRLEPDFKGEYMLDLPPSRGPPIPEAGFTLTGLLPTYSNRSGIVTQQQNFVLLGGHTRTAFLNTSQVAIWSMPEESWSFVTITSVTSLNSNTELTVKSTLPRIDSRSGHTTVLSEDGTNLIVYGGWVGDVGQAAYPQLVILRLGSGFGGVGDWRWIVPEQQPSTPALYGHGAAMLPGNVMMVVGGFEISNSNSKRQAASSARLWNATSMSWVTDYTNPAYVAAIAKEKAKEKTTSSNSNSRKLGLGLGIGLGVALLLAALIVFCCYVRKQRRKRDRREDMLNALGDANGVIYTPRGMQEREGGGFPWAGGRWNDRSRQPMQPVYDSDTSVAGYENLNRGVHNLGNSPGYPSPPKQIPRKPLHSRGARGSYQPAPGFDFNTSNTHARANSLGTAGPIHPIYEADEEEQSRKSIEAVGVAVTTQQTPDGKRHSDPFRDPQAQQTIQMPFRSGSLTETERSHRSKEREREREIQDWVSDWAAAETLMSSQLRSHSNAGRISPTRRAQLIANSTISSMSGEEDSGRTASNLSEQSVAVSSMSISRSGSSSQSRSRSNSLRGFINNAMSPFSVGVPSSTAPSTTLVSTAFDAQQHPPPKSAGSGSSSFTTAHTSFNALQVEGDTLLAPPDHHYASGQSSPTREYPEAPGSPSKNKAGALGRSRNSGGWLGSIRRAFAGSHQDDIDFQSIPSRDPSPVRIDQARNPPRRAVSEGGTLWRRKQGRSDWEDSALDSPGSRSNTFGNDVTSGMNQTHRESTFTCVTDDDEDWDIEQAVQNRVVQVMFTVPKEKLRVVNHDFRDDVSMSDIASLKSKQGSGKSATGAIATDLESVVEAPETPRRAQYSLSDPPVPAFTSKGKERDTDSPPPKWKGKEREVDLVREMEREVQREMEAEKLEKQQKSAPSTPLSGRRELRKPKSRVLDIVEDLEKRSSPKR